MPSKKNKKNTGRASQPEPTRAERLSPLFWPALLLSLVGLGSSIYLTNLHLRVHSAANLGSIESFCNVGEGMDCVAVAASSYSTFLGLPVALYGAEFYLLLTLALVLSGLRLWGIRRWDSLFFIAMLLALPSSVLMAYIALFKLKSLCLVCCGLYVINGLGLLLIGIAGRKSLGELLRAAPREVKASMGGTTGFALVAVLIIGISQLFWAPALFAGETTRATSPSDPELAKLRQKGFEIGGANAVVVIDEFTDYECPHCATAHDTLLKLVKRFPEKVRVRHYDFPLDKSCNRKIKRPFHRYACSAAYYARCAAKQGRYWPFAIELFHHQRALSPSDLEGYAKKVGLGVEALKSCSRGKDVRQEVLEEIEEGIRRNVRGTPTFFINGKETVLGPRPLKWWVEKVEALSK